MIIQNLGSGRSQFLILKSEAVADFSRRFNLANDVLNSKVHCPWIQMRRSANASTYLGWSRTECGLEVSDDRTSWGYESLKDPMPCVCNLNPASGHVAGAMFVQTPASRLSMSRLSLSKEVSRPPMFESGHLNDRMPSGSSSSKLGKCCTGGGGRADSLNTKVRKTVMSSRSYARIHAHTSLRALVWANDCTALNLSCLLGKKRHLALRSCSFVADFLASRLRHHLASRHFGSAPAPPMG